MHQVNYYLRLFPTMLLLPILVWCISRVDVVDIDVRQEAGVKPRKVRSVAHNNIIVAVQGRLIQIPNLIQQRRAMHHAAAYYMLYPLDYLPWFAGYVW